MDDHEFNLALELRPVVGVCIRAGMTLTDINRMMTREYLSQALKAAGNNQIALARVEGVHRNTISRTLRKFDIPSPREWKQTKT